MKSIDGNGNTLGTATYDVYGANRTQTGNPFTFNFAGEQTDATGLQYLRARYYDPATGTFMSRDPLTHAPGYAGSPQGYAGANPVMNTDPGGLAEVWSESNQRWEDDANGSYWDGSQWVDPLTGGIWNGDEWEDRDGNVWDGQHWCDPYSGAIWAPSEPASAASYTPDESGGGGGGSAGGWRLGGGPRVSGTPPPELSLSNARYRHIAARHFEGGSLRQTPSSTWGIQGAALKDLVLSVANGQPYWSNGRWVYIGQAEGAGVIGTNQFGVATSTFTVVAEADGRIVTAYPGMP